MDADPEAAETFAEDVAHPSDSIIISVIFNEGPLGINLKPSPQGIVYVRGIVPESQAIGKGIEIGDEIWSVASFRLEESYHDKEKWDLLIEFIKGCERPLCIIFRRRLQRDDLVNMPEGILQNRDDSIENSEEQVFSSRDSVVDDHSIDQAEKDSLVASKDTLSEEVSSQDSLMSSENQISEPIETDAVRLEREELESKAELLEIAHSLIFKDKERPSLLSFVRKPDAAQALQTSINMVVKTGRRLLKQWQAVLPTVGSQMAQSKRHFYLMSDVLFIAVPTGPTCSTLQVEMIFETQSLRLRDGLFPISQEYPSERSLEILHSSGNIVMAFDSQEIKAGVKETLLRLILSLVEESSKVLGWRHQYVLGSIHAAVISRDEYKVREILAAYESGVLSFEEIDVVDPDGFTATHYAVILRLHSIIRSLHHASADVTIVDSKGLSALHWAALQLDSIALTILCTNMFNPDVEDNDGLTPLFLACVEGRDSSGDTDLEHLQRCIQCLLAIYADANAKDFRGISCLQYLVSSWQYAAAELLIDAAADVLHTSGQFSWSSLHYAAAAASLKRLDGAASRILGSSAVATVSKSTGESGAPEALVKGNGVHTLRLLLDAGSRPNWRDARGRTALHILAENEFSWGSPYFEEATSLLVSCGARLDDSPQCQLLRSRLADVAPGAIDEAAAAWASKGVVDGDPLGLSLNCLEHAGEALVCFPMDGKEKCVMCSTIFTMFRRQHHCRLCGILCCDECSKKRVSVSSTQARACDACFNYSVRKATIFKERSAIGSSKRSTKTSSIASADSYGQKSELFGSAQSSAPSSRGGAEVAESNSQRAMSDLSEAQQRLAERGEKLSKLSDKTAEMANASQEFAKLARQLKEQNQNRWF